MTHNLKIDEEDRDGWRRQHDRLFEENKRLREALEKIIGESYHKTGSYRIYTIAKKALENL